MRKGGVALSSDIGNAAEDYGRRTTAIGKERRAIADLQDAMNHPSFKAEHHALLDRLAREYRASLPLIERTPWMTVTGGTHKSKKDLINAVKGAGHGISDWVEEVINSKDFTLLTEPTEIDVYETTVKELTGKDSLTTKELSEIRDRLGFCDAPDETALHIRMAYTGQPMNEWRTVLSKPVAGAGGGLDVLSVGRGSDGSWVGGYYADPGSVWYGGERLLVCRKRPLAP
jgi:hypothetical protein